jgi:hypothetical protein
MIASLIAMLAAVTVRSRFDDPDMWWHLKMGQVMWTTHAIPRTDLFSWTTNHHAYVPHEWLSQAFIYAAYSWAGYSGLMLWLSLISAALLVMGYILCSLYSGDAKVGFLGALTIWLFATVGFSIRPQLIGYLLLVIELLLIQLGRTRSPRWFFMLPLLFAIWVNCHGSFFLGLVVAAVYAFSSAFEFCSGSLIAVRWSSSSRKALIAALFASAFALLLNPAGLQLIRYPLQTLMVPSISVAAVSEWQPLQLSDGRGLALMAVMACIFLLVVARRSQLLFHELLLLILATWLAVSHKRMLFPFGILVAPILSRLMASSSDTHQAEHDRPMLNAVFIAASLVIMFMALPSRENLVSQVAEHSPVKAVDFIKSRHLAGPMLNAWDDGGYLVWALPQYPDFIDGRADVFEETGVVAEFAKWAMLESSPDSLLDKYHVNFCLLERGSPMATVLPLLPNWKTVYLDEKSVILVRVSPNTQPTLLMGATVPI